MAWLLGRPLMGLEIRGFKRAVEFSEVEVSHCKTKAKTMETCIFTSHPLIQQTFKEAAQEATMAITSAFDARVARAMNPKPSPPPTPAATPSSEQPPSSDTLSSRSPSGHRLQIRLSRENR
eukprot:54321-Karenia_brevis.AAC.1